MLPLVLLIHNCVAVGKEREQGTKLWMREIREMVVRVHAMVVVLEMGEWYHNFTTPPPPHLI
jgi:hypothetical protein